MSCPSMSIRPDCGSASRTSRESRVDFPAPEGPIRQVISPARAHSDLVKDRLARTMRIGRSFYADICTGRPDGRRAGAGRPVSCWRRLLGFKEWQAQQVGDPLRAGCAPGDHGAQPVKRPDWGGQAGQVGNEDQEPADGEPPGSDLDRAHDQRHGQPEAGQDVVDRPEPRAGVERGYRGSAAWRAMRACGGLGLALVEDMYQGQPRELPGRECGQLAGPCPGESLRAAQRPVTPPCRQRYSGIRPRRPRSAASRAEP